MNYEKVTVLELPSNITIERFKLPKFPEDKKLYLIACLLGVCNGIIDWVVVTNSFMFVKEHIANDELNKEIILPLILGLYLLVLPVGLKAINFIEAKYIEKAQSNILNLDHLNKANLIYLLSFVGTAFAEAVYILTRR